MDSSIPTDSNQTSNPSSLSPTPIKILIVEDDFFIRDLYELQAKKSGFEVVTASDGEEALNKAKDEMPKLILLDLMLPKMDGITVIKTLKSDPRFLNVPCILITNLEDSTKEQEAKSAGAAAYMLKIKNTPEQVIENIKTYLK